MTTQEVAAMIASVGLPYAYNHFDEPQNLPFICFLYPDNDNFVADNVNYIRVTALSIELYTNDADFDLEAAVEAVLTANELPFTKAQEYIEGERMYQTTFDTEVILYG